MLTKKEHIMSRHCMTCFICIVKKKITSLVTKCLPLITTEASFKALHYHPELTSMKGVVSCKPSEECLKEQHGAKHMRLLYRIGAQSLKRMTHALAAPAG